MSPEKLEVPILKELEKACEDYIYYIKSDERIGEDYDSNYVNEIFEKAIEAFYPEETIWDYINEED